MKTSVQINGIVDSISLGQELVQKIANRTFEIAQKDVQEANFSAVKMKSLTSDIMSDVSKQDNAQLMMQIMIGLLLLRSIRLCIC